MFTVVCKKYATVTKRKILEAFFKIYQSENVSSEKKTVIIKMLVIPMLLVTDNREFSKIFDQKCVDSMDRLIWSPMTSEKSVSDSFLVLELLQMTSLLLQHGHNTINDAKKNVIKFAWSFRQADDMTLKQASHVLMARFVQEFATPSKIIVQIFVNLLRSHQAEVRNIVRQAMDVLMPALPKRVPPTAVEIESNQASFWVRWTRRVMIDEGHTSTQLISLFQMIVRHASLYHESREHFVPHIVSNLVKIGLQTSPKDQKVLTIDLAELCLEWEKEGASDLNDGESLEHADKRRRLDVVDNSGTASPIRDGIMSFLIKFLVSLSDASMRKELGPRAMNLLRSFLKAFPSTVVSLAPFEKIQLLDVNESNASIICHSLEIIDLIVTSRDSAWIISNINGLSVCLEKYISCDLPVVFKSLLPILETVFKALVPCLPHPPAEANSFMKYVENVVRSKLSSMSVTNNTFITSLLMHAAYSLRKPYDMSAMYPDISKMLQRLVYEPVTANSAESLKRLFPLLRDRVNSMGGMYQKRTYLF